jgi:hypothetical protein
MRIDPLWSDILRGAAWGLPLGLLAGGLLFASAWLIKDACYAPRPMITINPAKGVDL